MNPNLMPDPDEDADEELDEAEFRRLAAQFDAVGDEDLAEHAQSLADSFKRPTIH